jgi:hypothetical protein
VVINVSKVVVVAGIKKIRIEEQASKLTAATQKQSQVDRRVRSNIVRPERLMVFELPSFILYSLLITRDALFLRNLLLEAANCL